MSATASRSPSCRVECTASDDQGEHKSLHEKAVNLNQKVIGNLSTPRWRHNSGFHCKTCLEPLWLACSINYTQTNKKKNPKWWIQVLWKYAASHCRAVQNSGEDGSVIIGFPDLCCGLWSLLGKPKTAFRLASNFFSSSVLGQHKRQRLLPPGQDTYHHIKW